MNNNYNRKPMIFLTLSWLVVLTSLYLETVFNEALFSRSGSLMVLFAVIADYDMLRTRDDYHSEQLNKHLQGVRVDFKDIHPSKSHQHLETAAHITIILGTIIWGYGDLLFQ